MALIVQKFGGTSVGSVECIRNVARRVAKWKAAGHDLVVVPSATPYIVTGMRVAMASSFMSIIPAEILAADSGIGYLLQKSSMLLQTNRIFVALLTICLLGFAADRLFRFFVERVLTRFMSHLSVI